MNAICALKLYPYSWQGKYLSTEDVCVKTPLANKICPVISKDIVLLPKISLDVHGKVDKSLKIVIAIRGIFIDIELPMV